jgi:hypothetical protein
MPSEDLKVTENYVAQLTPLPVNPVHSRNQINIRAIKLISDLKKIKECKCVQINTRTTKLNVKKKINASKNINRSASALQYAPKL